MQQRDIQDRRQHGRSSRIAVCFLVLSAVICLLFYGLPVANAQSRSKAVLSKYLSGVELSKEEMDTGVSRGTFSRFVKECFSEDQDALVYEAALIEEEYPVPYRDARRIDCYATLFERAHVDIWPYWMYTGDTPENDYDKDVIYGCYLAGVISEKKMENLFAGRDDGWTKGTISFGELINAATTIKTGNLPKAPGLASDINIEWTGDMRARNRAMVALTNVDDCVLQAFMAKKWTIEIEPKELAYEKHPHEVKYIGLCKYKDKRLIIVTDGSEQYHSIIHEMGHFIMGGKFDEYEKIYQLEHSKSVDLLGKYAQLNAKEYMAELYYQIREHANDPTWMAKLEGTLPQSYAYIKATLEELSLKYQ